MVDAPPECFMYENDICSLVSELKIYRAMAPNRESKKEAFEAGYVAGFNSRHYEQDWVDEAFVEWMALMGEEGE
jgi:hypothetical protein